jgi:hypothetical protein
MARHQASTVREMDAGGRLLVAAALVAVIWLCVFWAI